MDSALHYSWIFVSPFNDFFFISLGSSTVN